MKALILAAGLGSRLKPLTDTIPKAMAPVAGRPLLEHIILKLKVSGVNEMIINVHHFAEQIVNYVHAQSNYGIRIEFSDETGLLLDTGGGIKKASWFFDDGKPFFVHNVDILSDINLKEWYEQYLSRNAVVGLFVSDRTTNRYLLFDSNDYLCGWINEKTGEIKSSGIWIQPDECKKLAFNGIHIISPELLPFMNECTGRFSIIDYYLSIAGRFPIKAYHPKGVSVLDVGKLDSLQEAGIFIEKISSS